jgi:hypothetical protein
MNAAHVRAVPAIITRSGIALDFAIAIPPRNRCKRPAYSLPMCPKPGFVERCLQHRERRRIERAVVEAAHCSTLNAIPDYVCDSPKLGANLAKFVTVAGRCHDRTINCF